MRKCDFCSKEAQYVSRHKRLYVCHDHYTKYGWLDAEPIEKEPLRKCSVCSKMLPISSFYSKRAECKECNLYAKKKSRMKGVKHKCRM